MTYPQGPYGHGIPGHPGNPQPPGYPQGNPAQPYYQQGHPQPGGYSGGYPPLMQSAPPSGGTAITAGVLALLGGLAHFFGGAAQALGLSAMMHDSPAGDWGSLVAVVTLNIIAGALMLPGALALLLRKRVGRWLIAAGCGISIFSALINIMLTPDSFGEYSYARGVGADLVGVFFAIVTITLALAPSTTTWLAAKKNAVAPQYFAQYPPYRG